MEARKKRILVVDDAKSILEILSKTLSVMGYEVVVAGSGHDGLNLFLRNYIDLVLTDLDMPGVDGWTLALHIKDKSPNTPVVLMTGSESDDVMEKLDGSGVGSVLFKPFRWEDIENTIHGMIGKTEH